MSKGQIDPMPEHIQVPSYSPSTLGNAVNPLPAVSGSYTGTPFLELMDRDSLVGKICTFIDASIDDPVKRKAMKDQLKEIIRGHTQSPVGNYCGG